MTTPSANLQPSPRWPLIALGTITLVGLMLRLTNVFESLWLDELHTGWVVKDAWSDVTWRAQIGNQSPVWFYAVKLVTTLLGQSELTLRLLSLIAGTALIPVAYWLVGVLCKPLEGVVHRAGDFSSFAGLLAAALVAVDRDCIFYATEARPYAGLQLTAAVQLGLFWQILREPTTWRRLGWIGLTALMFHLHYTGILVLLGELAALVVWYILSRKPVPYRPWRALFDWQVVVFLCLPALPHVLEVGRRREMWNAMSQQPTWEQLFYVFPLHALLAIGLLAGGVALYGKLRGEDPTKPQAGWTTLGLVLVWFLLPLVAAWTAARFDVARLFIPRYLIALAIGPMLLTALLVAKLPWRQLQWLVAAGALAFAVYDSQIVEQLRYDGRAVGDRDEDWRGAIAWLRKQDAESELPVELYTGLIEEESLLFRDVATESHSQEKWAEYTQFPLNSLYELPNQIVPYAVIRGNRKVVVHRKWIVARGYGDRGISCILDPVDQATLGYDLVKEQSFGDVYVSQWQRD